MKEYLAAQNIYIDNICDEGNVKNGSTINPIIKKTYSSVIAFFQNRSRWKNLHKSRDDIITLNMNYKDSELTISLPNESDELRVNLYLILLIC